MLMSEFKFWGWDKKPRTMLRFIKPGDIFCVKLNDKKYIFGRIISKLFFGRVAEIFNYVSSTPEIKVEYIDSSKRMFAPIVLDSYTLFDRKLEKEADWRIIGHQNDYIPTNVDDVYFTFGEGAYCKKVDIWDNDTLISESEAKKLPVLAPRCDFDVKQLLKKYIKLE